MGMLMELMSHAILHRQKENLKRIHDKLGEHHKAHDDERRAHERAVLVQQQMKRLHTAVKLHSFRQQISVQMKAVQQVREKQKLQALSDKIGRVETGQQKLSEAMRTKTAAHEDVEKRLLTLKQDVDTALDAIKKFKGK